MSRMLLLSTALCLAVTPLALAQQTAPTRAAPGTEQMSPPTGAATSGTSKMSEAQLKQALEAQGYASVTGLKQQSDGTWTGKANYQGKPVTIGIDQSGQVTTR